jgi:alkylmercury lyase
MEPSGHSMAEPAVEIRPGVFRPDWSAITKPAARQALTGRLAARAGLLDRWSCRLEADQDVVWRTALRLYAKLGRAPSIADLAMAADMAADKLTTLLNDLESRDLIGLDRALGRIRLAYPFTEAETEHRVELNGRTLRALCAIDALGVAAMYGSDTTVTSPCRYCGATVQVATAAAGRELARVHPSHSMVWYDFAYDGSAAASCCPSIAFFCSPSHLQLWQEAPPNAQAGVGLSMGEALEVGRAIFGPILSTPVSVAG